MARGAWAAFANGWQIATLAEWPNGFESIPSWAFGFRRRGQRWYRNEMRAEPEVLDFLNELLTSELTAINQYFIHYKMCQNQGYGALAHKKRGESIEEMKHAEAVIERILFLDGIPNMQRLSPVRVGEEPIEMNQLDLTLELEAVERLHRGINLTLSKSDHGTRELLEKILLEEEDSVDWLETQASVVKDIGREHYLAQHLKSSS